MNKQSPSTDWLMAVRRGVDKIGLDPVNRYMADRAKAKEAIKP